MLRLSLTVSTPQPYDGTSFMIICVSINFEHSSSSSVAITTTTYQQARVGTLPPRVVGSARYRLKTPTPGLGVQTIPFYGMCLLSLSFG